MSEISNLWQHAIVWLSQHLVLPGMSLLHMYDPSLEPLKISEASMITLLQIGIIALVFRPLESLAPAERWEDRRLTRIDRLYTLIMLLGLFPIFSYLVLSPFDHLLDTGPASAEPTFNVRHWLPWLDHHPVLLLGIYYLAYDFVYYWMHRLQHLIPWWWALHSMHHSQRQMSCWTNDRGSYLDGILQSFILASVGILMGVDIAEFAWLTLISELIQNFSHTNVRFGFGRIFDKLLVDPKFHRLHHMVVDPQRPELHNCNFGQVFSVWDVLFGTALYGEPPKPTGVSDPVVDADNKRGLIAMQWHTLKRFWGAVRRPSGWRPGDVGFSEHDYEPIPTRGGMQVETVALPGTAG
ncbi:MAG TPA: sterol desaturase family protein [Methylophilaceae bacterium]|nr:sterol desaturase family protein [Methylophilaceae bacterium]